MSTNQRCYTRCRKANSTGEYDNEGFTLRGKVKTNNDGTYLIDTIIPNEVSAGDITRPGHVTLKSWILLVSQY